MTRTIGTDHMGIPPWCFDLVTSPNALSTGIGSRESARGTSTAVTTCLTFYVPAQHAFLEAILPWGPEGAEALPGAGLFIAAPTASPSPIRDAAHQPRPLVFLASPSRWWTLSKVPTAKRCPVTISEVVLWVPTWVLRNSAPSSDFRIFNFGEEGWLGVQTFLQDSQNKSKEMLIWGRAGWWERTRLWVFFSFVFFFFNIWTNLITLVSCSWNCVLLSLAVDNFSAGTGVVHSSNWSLSALSCALGELAREAIRDCGEDCCLLCF